jgi:segregation and condensation protein A
MPEEPYRVSLDNIFEGPMDLLVYLIKKNELNIYDIPIALVTDQYLQYIEWMQFMNVDFAGDFLVMASTLTQIKSRMLLPAHDGDEDEEDPRLVIVRPLLEYYQMKAAAETLAERNILGETTFVRSATPSEDIPEPEDEYIHVGLFELIDAFQRILNKIPIEQQLELTADRISVKERITQITDLLEDRGSITFEELFAGTPRKIDIIVTFLAILEMVKFGVTRIAQHTQSGVIRLFYL